MYEDTGVSGEVVTYTNGEVNKGTTDISKTAVKDTIGAQGRLTEVYEDEIVYIDTFLAQVTTLPRPATMPTATRLAKPCSSCGCTMVLTTRSTSWSI